MAASGCGANEDAKVKASILLHVIGEDALDICNSTLCQNTTLCLRDIRFSHVIKKKE